MKELWPNSKSDLVSFSATIQESLDKSDVNLNVPDNGLAEICEDGALACISKGCSLEIVNIKNGQRSSAFSFELQASHLQVSCFCSCQNKYLIGLKPQDEAQQSGILCLYDPGISRVVKCIKLDVVPTSICLIKEYGGAGDKSNFIRYMNKQTVTGIILCRQSFVKSNVSLYYVRSTLSMFYT